MGLISVIIGAFIVQYATSWFCKFKPLYGMAVTACIIICVMHNLFFATIIFMDLAEGSVHVGAIVLLVSIDYLYSAYILTKLIKHPETGSISYGKACLVNISPFALFSATFLSVFWD